MSAALNEKARKPAYILKIDFGEEIGIKTTSAQIIDNYQIKALIGKQVSAIMNFPPLRVAGVKSEVLVLAGVCNEHGTVLLQPTQTIRNGTAVA